MWDPPAVATRPTDRQRAGPELGEFEDFEDPLAPRDDSSLPARRSAPLSHESFSAVFGQSTRTGRWSAPDRITAVAWFGEVKLDFREAEIASDGVVEVEATAIFGQVTLRVPRGAEVELGGVRALFAEVGTKQVDQVRNFARRWLMGDDEQDYEDDPDDFGEEPMILRVKGRAIFGGVVVQVD